MVSVQHIGFTCRDVAKQEAFYTKFLGFRRARVFFRGTPDEVVMLRLGSVCIELFPPGGADNSARGGEQAIGFKHLAFEVDNMDEKIKELKDAGFQMGEIIDCSELVPGLRICFFNDPDGNSVELMEKWSDEDDAIMA